jgi:putative transposase
MTFFPRQDPRRHSLCRPLSPPQTVQLRDRTVFAGQAVGIKEVHDDIWPVSSMHYELGYFVLETRALEPLENHLGPKVLPL